MSMDKLFNDPVENSVANALALAGIKYTHESQNKKQSLDFFLPDYDCYIECKAFHTERTGPQIHGKQVILIQGYRAAGALVAILKGKANG